MVNARDSHFEASGFAGMKVQELEELIFHAKAFLDDDVQAAIINAVGVDPTSEAGQNAAQFSVVLSEKLEECAGICEQMKAELNRYSGGF